jgi:hypothetical protein
VREATALGAYPGNVQGRVAAKAYTEPSGLDLFVDGGAAGGRQPNLNVTNVATPRAVGSQSTVSGSQGPDPKAQLSLLLSGAGLSDVGRLAVVSVNAAALGNTTLLVVPAGMQAVILGASARVTAGSPGLPASGGIGTNGAADNVIASQQFTGLLAAPDSYELIAGGTGTIALSGETVSLGIDVVADAAQTIEVVIFGYLGAGA